MRTNLKAVLACILLTLGFPACSHAGGRIANPPNPLAQTITFNAWCRDGAIQIAVCNLGNAMQQIKAAVGCYDTTEHLFGSQSFAAEPKTINVVEFPVMKQPTPRGDMQQSDSAFVFVESEGRSMEVGFMPVQRVYQAKWDVSADSYLVEAGKQVAVTYEEKASDALRMVFVAKAAPSACTIAPAQKDRGDAQSITAESLKGLGLAPQAVGTYSELLKDNAGFMIQKGGSGRIKLTYATSAVEGCKVVTIPMERHVVDPAGGTAGGMGPSILLYDPKTITLRPVLHLTTIGESAGGRVGESRSAAVTSRSGP